MEGVGAGPLTLHEQNAADAHHIGPFNDDQADRNVPSFVLTWSWEKQHQEQPVEPLFQTGAFGGDGHGDVSSFLAQGGDEP